MPTVFRSGDLTGSPSRPSGRSPFLGKFGVVVAVGVAWVLTAVSLTAQTQSSPVGQDIGFAPGLEDAIARGDSLHRALDPSAAFLVFDSIADHHPDYYPALWRAAKEAVYVGMLLEEEERDEEALGWFAVADTMAQRSIEADSTGSDGYMWLSVALGRLALKEGPKSRIRFAERVRDAAQSSLDYDPMNAGAHHVFGVWHWKLAEVGGLSKFFAKSLLGGAVLDEASWDDAVAYLRRSVELEPWYMFHRLELARLYVAMGWDEWAVAELQVILTMDIIEPTDPPHLIEAREMLAALEAEGVAGAEVRSRNAPSRPESPDRPDL